MADKKYTLENKAATLLTYTTTVTKPRDPAPEAVNLTVKCGCGHSFAASAMRKDGYAVPCQRCGATIQARPTQKDEGQHFPKNATTTYVKDLRSTALAILRGVHSANECLFETEYQKRIDTIKEVLDDCNLMLSLIDISHTLGFVSLKRCEFWTRAVTDVKYMAASWKKKEGQRAKELEAARIEREDRRLASIIAMAIQMSRQPTAATH